MPEDFVHRTKDHRAYTTNAASSVELDYRGGICSS